MLGPPSEAAPLLSEGLAALMVSYPDKVKGADDA